MLVASYIFFNCIELRLPVPEADNKARLPWANTWTTPAAIKYTVWQNAISKLANTLDESVASFYGYGQRDHRHPSGELAAFGRIQGPLALSALKVTHRGTWAQGLNIASMLRCAISMGGKGAASPSEPAGGLVRCRLKPDVNRSQARKHLVRARIGGRIDDLQKASNAAAMAIIPVWRTAFKILLTRSCESLYLRRRTLNRKRVSFKALSADGMAASRQRDHQAVPGLTYRLCIAFRSQRSFVSLARFFIGPSSEDRSRRIGLVPQDV
ncbi:hypothetical protein E4U19_003060 [Claviceps sp. Clav32 group G5]|nr:hypothetical protein E4U19_003060 [Claviceps sp. Clav32 group G5]